MVVAALAMVGTLPGRTQGLGLVTEPLIKDLNYSRIAYAEINLCATLIGALFALGIGRLIDLLGSRLVLSGIVFLLGGVVVGMAGTHSQIAFVVFLTLTRGLGQSALSVASLALVGKWFVRRLNTAMAWYSIALSMGFIAAFPLVGAMVESSGWRVAWGGIGWTLLLGLTPLLALAARNSPESMGLPADGKAESAESPVTAPTDSAESATDYTLGAALRFPSFWIIGLASAVYGLIASGIGLFNESVLTERGFAPTVYHTTLAVTALTSLIGNFFGGWLTANRPLRAQHQLMGVSMLLLMISLLALTQVRTLPQIMVVAVVMGIAGGFVIVIFFAYWARTFGRLHLGQIQGVAQALTVVASAVGPLLLAQCVTLTGSYSGVFFILAAVVGLFGIAAWFAPVPKRG